MQNLFVHFNACDKKTYLYPEYFGIRAGIISIQPLVRTLLVTSALIGQVTPSTVVLGVHGQTQPTVSHHVLAFVNLNWNSNVILTYLHGLKGNICCTTVFWCTGILIKMDIPRTKSFLKQEPFLFHPNKLRYTCENLHNFLVS